MHGLDWEKAEWEADMLFPANKTEVNNFSVTVKMKSA